MIWLILGWFKHQCNQKKVKKEDFRKEINQALDKVGFYNPFTLKAVVDGKGNVKILFYNIERYSKKEIDTIFHTIDKTYTQWYKISLQV